MDPLTIELAHKIANRANGYVVIEGNEITVNLRRCWGSFSAACSSFDKGLRSTNGAYESLRVTMGGVKLVFKVQREAVVDRHDKQRRGA